MPTRNPHVLLAEDDDTWREMLSRLLVELGHNVTAVRNGGQALTHIRRVQRKGLELDILVTDQQMRPGPTGLDVVAVARKRWPFLPIIVQSGDDSIADDVAAARGVFLRKSYGTDELITALALAPQAAKTCPKHGCLMVMAPGPVSLSYDHAERIEHAGDTTPRCPACTPAGGA